MSPAFPYLCALRFAIGTLWTTEVVILTGRSILPAGTSNEDTPAVIAMKAELTRQTAKNCALQGSCTLLPLLPIQGRRGDGAGIVSISKSQARATSQVQQQVQEQPAKHENGQRRCHRLPAPSATSKGRSNLQNTMSAARSRCINNEPTRYGNCQENCQEQRAKKVWESTRATSQGTGIVKSNEPRRYGNCREREREPP